MRADCDETAPAHRNTHNRAFETCGEQPVIYLLAALMIAGNLATRAAEMRTLHNPPILHIHLGGRVPW